MVDHPFVDAGDRQQGRRDVSDGCAARPSPGPQAAGSAPSWRQIIPRSRGLCASLACGALIGLGLGMGVAGTSLQAALAPAEPVVTAAATGGPADAVAVSPDSVRSVQASPTTFETSPQVTQAKSLPTAQTTEKPSTTAAPVSAIAGMTMETFLDRLMIAESGGRDDARNPRSTATGPFQFIEATFLDVVRRHFAAEVAGWTDPQVLTLRTVRPFARRAAEAFSRDNAAALAAEGLPVTFPHLRLAFLLGPTAAVRVLQAAPETPAAPLLGAAVVTANPFMAGMTAGGLAARAARDLALPIHRMARADDGRATIASLAEGLAPTAATKLKKAPALAVRCNRALPSCRRWVSLQTRILANRAAKGRRGVASAQR